MEPKIAWQENIIPKPDILLDKLDGLEESLPSECFILGGISGYGQVARLHEEGQAEVLVGYSELRCGNVTSDYTETDELPFCNVMRSNGVLGKVLIPQHRTMTSQRALRHMRLGFLPNDIPSVYTLPQTSHLIVSPTFTWLL